MWGWCKCRYVLPFCFSFVFSFLSLSGWESLGKVTFNVRRGVQVDRESCLPKQFTRLNLYQE